MDCHSVRELGWRRRPVLLHTVLRHRQGPLLWHSVRLCLGRLSPEHVFRLDLGRSHFFRLVCSESPRQGDLAPLNTRREVATPDPGTGGSARPKKSPGLSSIKPVSAFMVVAPRSRQAHSPNSLRPLPSGATRRRNPLLFITSEQAAWNQIRHSSAARPSPLQFEQRHSQWPTGV